MHYSLYGGLEGGDVSNQNLSQVAGTETLKWWAVVGGQAHRHRLQQVTLLEIALNLMLR